jgi:hypothetical protein
VNIIKQWNKLYISVRSARGEWKRGREEKREGGRKRIEGGGRSGYLQGNKEGKYNKTVE